MNMYAINHYDLKYITLEYNVCLAIETGGETFTTAL